MDRPIGSEESSAHFWDRVYRQGGTSGTGSAMRLAKFKAEIVNGILTKYRIRSAVELGCGDGSQLSLIAYRSYVGLDTSPAAIERCRERFADDPTRRFAVYSPFSAGESLPQGDLSVSLDVIYHLLEDEVYERYMSDLFAVAGRLVLIYSSDKDESSPWDEVRHRHFTDWVARRQPQWRILARIPQRFPYVEGDHETSWCDFFLYRRLGVPYRGRPQDRVRDRLAFLRPGTRFG